MINVDDYLGEKVVLFWVLLNKTRWGLSVLDA